jgi:phospholipid/cholesterol/gamma-HCH transport system substrate-binding protein
MKNTFTKIANLKVGLTVFIGLLIALIFIFLVGTEGNYFSKTYSLKLKVENVEGLTVGAPVSLGGLKIGSVKNIEFLNKNNQNQIVIDLEILEKYQPQITENSVAFFRTIGLLGDKFVDVSIGQPGQRVLGNGEYLPVKPSFSLEAIGSDLQPAAADFADVMSNLKIITENIASGKGTVGQLISDDKSGSKISSILNNLNSFSEALSNQQGSLGKLAYDPALYSSLTELTANLKSVSDSLMLGKGTLGKLLTDQSLFNNLNSVTEKLNKIIASTENDSTLAGGMLNDGKFYSNLNSVLKNLNVLIVDLKENPDRYIQLSVF